MASPMAEVARRPIHPAVVQRLRVQEKLQKGAHTCVRPETSPAQTLQRWKRALARGSVAQNTFMRIFIVNKDFPVPLLSL